MIGVVGQGNMGGPYQGLVDPPAAPTDAHSASNGNLGDKAPLGFVPYSSLNIKARIHSDHKTKVAYLKE